MKISFFNGFILPNFIISILDNDNMPIPWTNIHKNSQNMSIYKGVNEFIKESIAPINENALKLRLADVPERRKLI